MNHEVVIIGGGFGGVRVAKIIAKWGHNVHITLIDKSRYHTFQPYLYEVAAIYMPEVFVEHPEANFYKLRATAAYPLEDIFFDDLNVTIVEDKVVEIDFKAKEVLLRSGVSRTYDILVVAVGSDTNYFDIPGLSERALPLKSVFDALTIRNVIDEMFFNTPKNRVIKIVIGGGGFTGCELGAELIGYLRKLSKLHGRPHNSAECMIIEAASVLIGSASLWVQEKAKSRLTALGVKLSLASPIKAVKDKNIVLKNNSNVSFDILIWTAGVMANDLTHSLEGVQREKDLCLRADKCLRVVPHRDVFSVGDVTYCIDERTGKSLPMTASVALREAKYVAENIKHLILKEPLVDCVSQHPGFIVPLGSKYALFDGYGIRLAGFFPWVLKHLVALHYWWSILGWRKAFKLWRSSLSIFIRND